MVLDTYYKKLDKIDGNTYVIEEEVQFHDGIYEAELQHDNINESTLTVHTGKRLSGTKIETYSLSTPSLAPWKRLIRIYSNEPVAYITYETNGDTVEAEDINRIQNSIIRTQNAVNTENERSIGEENKLRKEIIEEQERAVRQETSISKKLEEEIGRASVAEQVLLNSLESETIRAQEKERELQENIVLHTETVDREILKLQSVNALLDEKKANVEDMERELADRYTKGQTFTKQEVLNKIEELIGSAPDLINTFEEVAKALGNDPNFSSTIMGILAKKVDAVEGKNLSQNDFTNRLFDKLNGIDDKANNYTHPSTPGNKHIPSGGTTGQVLRWSSDGTAQWGAEKDITYSAFEGATIEDAGTSGLVPAPAAGKQNMFMRGDGTWNLPENTTYKEATETTAGLMSSEDKKKVNQSVHVGCTWTDLMGV